VGLGMEFGPVDSSLSEENDLPPRQHFLIWVLAKAPERVSVARKLFAVECISDLAARNSDPVRNGSYQTRKGFRTQHHGRSPFHPGRSAVRDTCSKGSAFELVPRSLRPSHRRSQERASQTTIEINPTSLRS
jgi:hypothetical protein